VPRHQPLPDRRCRIAGAKLCLVMLLASLLVIALAYLLGSIPVGYLLVRVFLKQDVRSVGSGNIGATNVLRSGGKGLGAATFFLDVLKGYTAVYVGGLLGVLLAPEAQLRNMQALAALFAVLGHVFPVWLRFKGGKGVATGFGVFLLAAPTAALAAIAVFGLILLLTPYVSLASILGAAAFPFFAWMLVRGDRPPFFIAVQFAVSLIIIAKHHQNIRRLLAGTESRLAASSARTKKETV
jgi:acyl phosphate:glycerol-3-phosphate acyltransferase